MSEQMPAVVRIVPAIIITILPGANESTGYHKIIIIGWSETYNGEVQNHTMAVNMWNEVARDFKTDGYSEGDVIEIYTKLKSHTAEKYLELTDIGKIIKLDQSMLGLYGVTNE